MHDADGKLLLQILHAGRYAYHPLSVSASSIKAPINPFRPRRLSSKGVQGTVEDFVRCAQLAREAGYDGVEIMGSEGYLLNQFLAPRTNRRTDCWGGTPEKRRRLPVEIVRRTRAAVGADFIICYRMSMADYVPTVRAGTRSSRWQPKSRTPVPPSSTPASAGMRPECPPS